MLYIYICVILVLKSSSHFFTTPVSLPEWIVFRRGHRWTWRQLRLGTRSCRQDELFDHEFVDYMAEMTQAVAVLGKMWLFGKKRKVLGGS